jgi:thiol-disulfide isomerase/thioredoxin
MVLPAVAAFVGLIGLVGTVTYYGSQQIESKTPVTTVVSATATTSRLQLFNEAEYDAAKLQGKAILLYFTADWCPECDYAKMRLTKTAVEWSDDQVVIFLVNFANQNASSTNPEAKLVKDFEVTAPDTKVLLRGEKVIKQSTEVWTAERYREEIANLSD